MEGLFEFFYKVYIIVIVFTIPLTVVVYSSECQDLMLLVSNVL